MGASAGERAAFQEALERVSGSATVMEDPAQMLRRRRQRGALTALTLTTTTVCLTLLGTTVATGIMLSATYTAEPDQPLWKPLTVILPGAFLVIAASLLIYRLHDSWRVPALVVLGWIPALLAGYVPPPLITDHDYGGRALAAAIGFL
ncbi:hypothetical protein [Streptomyces sp. NPDC055055]